MIGEALPKLTKSKDVVYAIDVGARYGLHPNLQRLGLAASSVLIEADPEEASALEQEYAGSTNISVISSALGSHIGSRTLYRRSHRGLSSFFPEANEAQLVIGGSAAWTVESSQEVHVATLDALNLGPPDYVKVDVEGSEVEVLKGGRVTLGGTVLVCRIEVSFNQAFGRRETYSQVDALLRSLGFELLNLDYDGRGLPASQFRSPGRYGQIRSVDATWVSSEFLHSHERLGVERIVRGILLLFIESAGDLAFHLLAKYSASIRCLQESPQHTYILASLELEATKWAQVSLRNGWASDADLAELWPRSFGHEFPYNDKYWATVKHLQALITPADI